MLLTTLGLVGLLLVTAATLHYGAAGQWTMAHWIMLFTGAILLTLTVVFSITSFSSDLDRRRSRQILFAAVATMLMAGILILLNLIALEYNRRLDTSPDQSYSLTAESIEILRLVSEDIHLLAFLPETGSPEELQFRTLAQGLLREYSSHTPRLTWEIIDPDRSPERARQFKIRRYGSVAIIGGEQTEIADEASERAISSALLKILNNKTRSVYFLTGHGERTISGSEGSGFSRAAESLRENNFEVSEVNLADEQTSLDPDSILVVPGPETDLMPAELEYITAWTGQGGSLLLLLEPPPSAGWNSLLASWGLRARPDLVLDNSQTNQLLGTSMAVPMVSRYPAHHITSGLTVMSLFPSARSFERLNPVPENWFIKYLLRTNPGSWGETDFSSSYRQDQPAEFTPGKDVMGPVDIGFTVEHVADFSAGDSSAQSRVAVIGDADFASNNYFDSQANGDLFLRTIRWLAADENLVSIRARDHKNNPIILSQGEHQIVLYLTVFCLPLLPMIGGIWVLFRRRRRK